MDTERRGSYNDKNNIKKQMDFLEEKFLPLLGIFTLRDTETEIIPSRLKDYKKVSELIPEIQKLFKTSGMNLGRSNYQISKTNVLPVLKNMCAQAHIPYEVTKYSNYYTFALSPINELLLAKRHSSSKKVKPEVGSGDYPIAEKTKKVKNIMDRKFEVLEKSILSSKLDDLPYFRLGNDLLFDLCSEDYMTRDRFYNVKSYSKRYCFDAIWIEKITTWYECDGKKYVLWDNKPCGEFTNKIKNIKLYDEFGNCIHTTDAADIMLHEVSTIKRNVTNVQRNLGFFLGLGIAIPDEVRPTYYKITLEQLEFSSKDSLMFKEEISYTKNIKITWTGSVRIPLNLSSNVLTNIKYEKDNFHFRLEINGIPIGVSAKNKIIPSHNNCKLVTDTDEEASISFNFDMYKENELVLDNKTYEFSDLCNIIMSR